MTTSKHQELMTRAHDKWMPVGLSYRDFLHKLDAVERRAVVIGHLNNQVHNGGFNQWADNRYVEGAEFLREALTAVGTETALRVRDLADRAVKISNGVEERVKRSSYYVDLEEDYSELSKLDDVYYELSDQLMADAEAYFSG